jgi:hypothetical protein
VNFFITAFFHVFSILTFILLPSLGHAKTTTQSQSSYWLFPDSKNESGVWLLNTRTGSLSKCVFVSMEKPPECSPWANPPGDNPEYRYDVKTKKLIPMNEAARKKEEKGQSKN